ncbi:MAG: amidohydrolase family protein [Chloroflexota bacterium]
MQIVDAHAHVFPPEVIRQRAAYRQRDRWFGLLYANPRARLATADELVAALDAAGVGRAVAFGFAFADVGLCRACNDYTLDAARRFAGRLIPLAVTNPAAGAEGVAEARRALEGGARGLGELMPEGQGYSLDDAAALDPLMALARAAAAPLWVHVNEPVGHAYPGKGAQGPAEAYRLAVRYPENDLVLAHWGGGLPFYELMPEVRATLRRVYYDTAASPYLYAPEILAHVAAWAPHKVLFGSDYPLIAPSRALAYVRAAHLADEPLTKLLGANVLRLLGGAGAA